MAYVVLWMIVFAELPLTWIPVALRSHCSALAKATLSLHRYARAAAGQPDPVLAVVVGGVAADRRVRRRVEIDARPRTAPDTGLPAELTWLFEIVMWFELAT